MSKPWEDSDFYRDDRYENRREDRWEPKRSERRWGDRDGAAAPYRQERPFAPRKPRFNASRGFANQKKDYGNFSGPRAKAQVEKCRRVIDVNQEGRTVIVLDEDVARVFETAPEVNAALRKVIELAQILGPVKGAKRPDWLDAIQAGEQKAARDEDAGQTALEDDIPDAAFPTGEEAVSDIPVEEAPQDDIEIGEARPEE